MKFILGIAAGKGGVGKSSLTVNLALCLQKMGKRVGILDADLYGPSIRKMLPEDLPTRVREEDQKILPAERNGIKLITVSYFQDSERAVIVRAPIANGLIKQFFHDVDWGDLDLLLVDFPPGTGDIQLTLLQEASFSGGLVITTPQEVALQDVSKAIALFDQMHVPVLGCVENMSYFEEPVSKQRYFPFGQQGGWRLSQQEGIPFLGEIPIDAEISRCADAGISLLEEVQGQAAAQCYREIAQKVWEQLTAWESLEGKCLKKFELLRITQKDVYAFTIEWADGKIASYRLSDLQRQCTCARCREQPRAVDEQVQAVRIVNVGRYALRVDFTSGCSKGIYSFAFLRRLSEIC